MLALLAYLGVTGEAHTREKLAAIFWPESGSAQAFSYLRRDLAALKKEIGDRQLDIERETVRLAVEADFELDVHRFRELLAASDSHVHQDVKYCATCIQLLTQAGELYTGDFMDGFTLPDCPAFDEWQFFTRDALRNELSSALIQLIDGLTARSQLDQAIHYALRWLALDPWHEPAHRQVIRLFAWNGNYSAAERQYQECVRLLNEEFGQPPQPETVELYQQLRARSLPPAPSQDRTGGKVTLNGQPGAGGEKPAQPRHNLAPAPTPFIGREQELADILSILANPDCRMLTVVGPGGIGKTRLAAESALQALGQFPNGAFLVSLASVSSPDFLVSSIADAIGYIFQGKENLKAQLVNYLREKQLLLVLDNFEQLVEGAELLVEIIQQAPGVKLLITSRERLNLQWEWVLEIRGLTYPAESKLPGLDLNALLSENEIQRYSAIGLFLQNIRRLLPAFNLTENSLAPLAKICQIVDGHPLAIELASAWVKMMPLEEIEEEISRNIDFLRTATRDLPERHRSIRALFEHTWDLLSNQERDSLQKLSVFQGSFNRQAAQSVAGASLVLLASLVDKSILRADSSGRYILHGLLRQFALDRMKDQPEKLLQARVLFLEYFAAFLHGQSQHLKSGGQVDALAAITTDIDNVRAAWQWAIRLQDETALEQSLDALYQYYFARSWYQEAADAFRQAAQAFRPGASQRTVMLSGRLLAHQARFVYRLGDENQARGLLGESLALFERLEQNQPADIQKARAGSLYNLSEIERGAGNYEKAQLYCLQSLEIYRQYQDKFGMARSFNHLGVLAAWQGQYEHGKVLLQQALDLYRSIDYRYGIANTLNDLGNVSDRLGQPEQARELYQECLAIRRQIGHLAGIGASLNNLGFFAYHRGEYQEASHLLQESLAIQKEIGDRYEIANCLSNLGSTARALQDYAGSYRYYHDALRISADINHVPLMLEILGGTATNFALGNRAAQALAVEIFAFVLAQPASDRPTRDNAQKGLEMLRGVLNSDDLEAARQAGLRVGLDDLVLNTTAYLQAGGQ